MGSLRRRGRLPRPHRPDDRRAGELWVERLDVRPELGALLREGHRAGRPLHQQRRGHPDRGLRLVYENERGKGRGSKNITNRHGVTDIENQAFKGGNEVLSQ